MRMASYRPTKKALSIITMFRGLNRGANTGFSNISAKNSTMYTEFKGMRNLSSDDYPQLSVRKKRGRVNGSFPVTGGGSCNYDAERSGLLFADGKIIFVTSAGIYYDGSLTLVSGLQSNDANNRPVYHELVLFGNRVVIMPEKIIFDLSTKTSERIEVTDPLYNTSANAPAHEVTPTTGTINGTEYSNYNDNGFTIEKVELDSSGKPRHVAMILKEADSLDNDQAQVSGQVSGDREAWKTKITVQWAKVKVGDTVEAMGENPSGLYRCWQIGEETEAGAGGSYRTIRHFVKIENYYVRIWRSVPGISVGDYVTLSGMTAAATAPTQFEPRSGGQSATPDASFDWGDYVSVLNNQTFKVYYVDQYSFVIKANIDRSVPYTGYIKVQRKMPALDSDKLIEVNNRMWGCSSVNNEIYASKLGDIKNWRAYADAIATDSYAVTVGCEGQFTGVARQNGNVIFFKENKILKLYGTKPSNFTLAEYDAPGVEKGSSKSLVWINGILYYLSPRGVCQYSPGGQPAVISEDVFGDKKYKNGVGGRHGDKYYLSAQSESGLWELFVYDTRLGIWHREDEIKILAAATYNGKLYFSDSISKKANCADGSDNLISEYGDYEKEDLIEWYAETGDLYGDTLFKKHITRIKLSIAAEEPVRIGIFAKFRVGGEWFELKKELLESDRLCVIPCAVRRSDYLRIKLEGQGRCRIAELGIEYSAGSDR